MPGFGRTHIVGDHSAGFLATTLRKRIESLGYTSLKKFARDSTAIPFSYELLRQVVYGGRVPRAETLLTILQALRFTPSQIQKLMAFHFGGYPLRGEPASPGPVAGAGEGNGLLSASQPNASARSGGAPGDERGRAPIDLSFDAAEDVVASLQQTLPRIPVPGNEDFWEMARTLALQAERKVSHVAGHDADQPLLFEKEPEAIYQFLVRRGKIPSYMAKGETVFLAFDANIDYRDRFRGALLGSAVGEVLGRLTQGLSPRDIRELFGRIDGPAAPGSGNVPFGDQPPPACLLLSRALLSARKLDPERIAGLFARSRRMPGTGDRSEFARNLLDRKFPWFESGAGLPESAPAARVAPLALLRAGNFRLLKLETGIEAAITHPHPASLAAAIAQASAVARLLHTSAEALDVLGFARGLSHVVAGVEADRPPRGGRTGAKGAPTIWRRLGTELTALLLRRAEPEEAREALGNGPAASEGIPFAWACFLRYPEDFASAVLAAVNLGSEAEANAAMVGSLAGAYLGAGKIPERFLEGLIWQAELEASADRLLAFARKEP